MTTYATRSPLQVLTNTYHIMADQPSSNRRTSARLKFKDDVFAISGPEMSRSGAKSKQSQGTAKIGATKKSKRKINYEEDDDGFKFTRSQPKRVKAAPTVSKTEVETSSNAPGEKPVTRRRSRRKSLEPDEETPKEEKQQQSPRKADIPQDEQQSTDHASPLPKQPRQRVSPRKNAYRQAEVQEKPTADVSEQPSLEPMKIALPFADTPVIRRNKEMRKGNNEGRRSSLSMRGRRASSLMESGTSNALPHEDIEAADFYKHIESSVPEPRRMRQLLIWCGLRAMGKKPSFATEDSEVKLAAWQIQQELFKEFSSKSELSDWFSREETTSQPRTLKPNPRNTANLVKIEEVEQKLKALRAEQEQWAKLQQRPDPSSLALPPLPPIEKLSLSSLPHSTLAASTSLQKLLKSKHATTEDLTASIQTRLETVKTDFQLNLDQLLDSVNKIGQHLAAAERASTRVLRSVARVLDEKDKLVLDKEGSVGTMDTLRALTRVIDRN